MFAEGFCHDADMSAERFAAVVLERFRALGLETDEEVGAAGGPSTSTMTKIRAARDRGADLPRPRRDAAQRIERAARWAPGSVRRLYDGGDPDELDARVRPDVYSELVELLNAMPPEDQERVLEQLREQRPDGDSVDSATRLRQA